MRTLLIIPPSDLIYARSEADRVINALHPTIISDDVTLPRLLDVSGEYDLIWFIAHGSSDGVELTDVTLSKSAIARLVRRVGAQAIVLNTCDSIEVALALHDSIGVSVIATIAAVKDAQALVTGVTFADELAAGRSLVEAYTVARPLHNTSYVFLGDKESGGVMTTGRDPKIDDIALIVQAVLGNERTGVNGLIKDVRALDERVAGLESKIMLLLAEIDNRNRRSLGRIELILLGLFSGLITAIGTGAIWLTLP